MQQQSKVLLFYSCHPSDEIVSDKLAQFFRSLVREGYLEQWSVEQILPGTEMLKERKRAFESATCILLLLSAEYLASEMHYEEMLLALERRRNGVPVIPIVVRPVLFPKELETSLSSCLPENGRPVSTWKKREDGLFEVAQSICQILRLPLTIRRRRSSSDSNRDYLLDQVFSNWIEGFLEPSLHGRMPLHVRIQEVPDALGNPETRVNPWHEEVQELRRVFRPFPPEISILQAYDEAYGELLILGEPGAGKTIALLELTRLLLKRAEKEERIRVPVVFPLSSWARERQALEIWLVKELKRSYGLSRKYARQLIDNDAILPLLDGLDEVAEAARADCVQAIETYRTEIQRELVVCCRRKEYFALPRRFTLQRAISLEPLTDKQIERYIQQAEHSSDLSLQDLRQAFQADSELNELAQQPLMLDIFTLTYQDTGAVELLTKSTFEAKLHLIFSNFIGQMLTRRGVLRTGTREQFHQQLMFTATQLNHEQETLLTLEYLQPTWLSGWPRRLYWWSVRLVIGFIGYLLFELLFALPTWLIGVHWKVGTYLLTPSIWLLIGLYFGLIPSIAAQIVVETYAERSWKALILGPVLSKPSSIRVSLAARRAAQKRIRPTEAIHWSWKYAWRGALISASLLGVMIGLSCGLDTRNLLGGVVVGLIFGIFGAVFGGVLEGVKSKQHPERGSLRPNRAIWLSGRSGLVIGIIVGLMIGLIFGLPIVILSEKFHSQVGLVFGLSIGDMFTIGAGMFFGQIFGINAFIQHFVLRFWLWRTHSLPWNPVPFLEEATERLLLRKVGNSFMFIHRALQDYLATLETSKDEM